MWDSGAGAGAGAGASDALLVILVCRACPWARREPLSASTSTMRTIHPVPQSLYHIPELRQALFRWRYRLVCPAAIPRLGPMARALLTPEVQSRTHAIAMLSTDKARVKSSLSARQEERGPELRPENKIPTILAARSATASAASASRISCSASSSRCKRCAARIWPVLPPRGCPTPIASVTTDTYPRVAFLSTPVWLF